MSDESGIMHPARGAYRLTTISFALLAFQNAPNTLRRAGWPTDVRSSESAGRMVAGWLPKPGNYWQLKPLDHSMESTATRQGAREVPRDLSSISTR